MTAQLTDGLRVGLICPYSFDSPGGVQNQVLGLAAHLQATGHEPYVLAPGRLGAAATLDPARFTSAGRAVPLRYNGSTARVTFGPVSAWRVRRWLRSHRLDLLHLHEPITPSVALLALLGARCPVVATFHTATPRSRTMQLAGRLLRPLIDRIDARIAVSAAARDVVVRYLGRDALVVPNGIRLADFPPSAARSGPPRIAFLGRTDEPRKGLEVLLAAVPAIRAAYPDAEVVIAGRGRPALPAGCQALGFVDDQARAALLGSADVFVAPHTARESFGIVLLEAMAAGSAVVASDLPAFCDVLQIDSPRPLGTVFATADPAALAAAVVATLRTPCPQRIENARRATADYDWSRIGPRILAVYATVLAGAGGAPASSQPFELADRRT